MPDPDGTGRPAQRAWAAVTAVTVLNLPLGSIYAFSVFLEPIEHDLAISRSALSLVFGLASIGFTVGTNPGLFNAQYMTRMARIALMPPKAMRCRPSETL